MDAPELLYFRCTRLEATLSLAACRANRAKPRMTAPDGSGIYRPTPCIDCWLAPMAEDGRVDFLSREAFLRQAEADRNRTAIRGDLMGVEGQSHLKPAANTLPPDSPMAGVGSGPFRVRGAPQRSRVVHDPPPLREEEPPPPPERPPVRTYAEAVPAPARQSVPVEPVAAPEEPLVEATEDTLQVDIEAQQEWLERLWTFHDRRGRPPVRQARILAAMTPGREYRRQDLDAIAGGRHPITSTYSKMLRCGLLSRRQFGSYEMGPAACALLAGRPVAAPAPPAPSSVADDLETLRLWLSCQGDRAALAILHRIESRLHPR